MRKVTRVVALCNRKGQLGPLRAAPQRGDHRGHHPRPDIDARMERPLSRCATAGVGDHRKSRSTIIDDRHNLRRRGTPNSESCALRDARLDSSGGAGWSVTCARDGLLTQRVAVLDRPEENRLGDPIGRIYAPGPAEGPRGQGRKYRLHFDVYVDDLEAVGCSITSCRGTARRNVGAPSRHPLESRQRSGPSPTTELQ
jgi:hypothetical protein